MPDKLNQQNFYPCNHLEIVRGGRPYFSRLYELIDQAEQSIHFQVYLFDYDTTGKKVLDLLYKAADRGVEVYLIIDAFGSSSFPDEEAEKLEASEVHFRIFGPLFSSSNLGVGRRMHHKVFIADEKKALVGGINVADKYNDIDGHKAWLDFAAYVEDERICRQLKRVCLEIWGKEFLDLDSKKAEKEIAEVPPSGEHLVQINLHDWLRAKIDIGKSYKNAFEDAQDSIFILGSYFMPSRRIRKRLKAASQRGVKVHVVLSKYADVPLTAEATRFLYEWMFRHRIRIYEWTPSVLHGKIALVDNEWSTVGSYNLNFLSDYESIELNLAIISKSINTALRKELKQVIEEGCDEVQPEHFQKSYHLFRRLQGWFAYIIVRYSFRFLMLFSRKEKR